MIVLIKAKVEWKEAKKLGDEPCSLCVFGKLDCSCVPPCTRDGKDGYYKEVETISIKEDK